jgi:hypothetical protein
MNASRHGWHSQQCQSCVAPPPHLLHDVAHDTLHQVDTKGLHTGSKLGRNIRHALACGGTAQRRTGHSTAQHRAQHSAATSERGINKHNSVLPPPPPHRLLYHLAHPTAQLIGSAASMERHHHDPGH